MNDNLKLVPSGKITTMDLPTFYVVRGNERLSGPLSKKLAQSYVRRLRKKAKA
jgi:hypothetical protein